MSRISSVIIVASLTTFVPASQAAIVLVSQSRTVVAGPGASAPGFGAWNESRSSNVVSTNPSTPGLIVGSVTASQNSPAITPTSMSSQMSVGFSALRIGAGSAAQSRFEVVFDVDSAPSDVRISYTSAFTGAPVFTRTTRLTLDGPTTYLRQNVSSLNITDLTLTPGRYTLTGLAEIPARTSDASFGATLNFSLTVIPTPATAAIFCGLASTGLLTRRRR